MKIVKFSVVCTAIYESELELPDDVDTNDQEEVLGFIRDSLSDVPVGEMNWLEDLDPDEAVTLEDIRSIEEV